MRMSRTSSRLRKTMISHLKRANLELEKQGDIHIVSMDDTGIKITINPDLIPDDDIFKGKTPTPFKYSWNDYFMELAFNYYSMMNDYKIEVITPEITD